MLLAFINKLINVFKSKIVYVKHSPDEVLDNNQKEFLEKNKKILSDACALSYKVKFVFQSSFEYDVDKNVICPKYEVMLPIKEHNGLLDSKSPIIEIGKPINVITVNFITYKVDDNHDFIKQMAKRSKRGVVIFLGKETTILNHKTEPYQFSVDSEYIRVINLDDAVEYFIYNNL